MEATVEAHIMAAARVRESCGIPGVSVKTSYLCRDKPAMKEALRQGGIACAQSIGTDSPDDVRAFVETVGYPLIIKPRDAAGAADTWRVGGRRRARELRSPSRVSDTAPRWRSRSSSRATRASSTPSASNGEIMHYFATHYYPGVLEAMRTRWISPQFIATNRLDAEGYDEVKAMGKKVIDILEIGTSATHMEWFFGPKGLKFSEIGCRPPGVGAWDLYCARNDMDVYKEWGMAIVHGRPSQKPSPGLLGRPDQPAPRPATATSSATRASSSWISSAARSSTITCRLRAARPSRSRPVIWPTPGCA